MARPIRVNVENGYYHYMIDVNRYSGINKLFDKEMFDKALTNSLSRHHVKLLAYSVTASRVQFYLSTRLANLDRFARSFAGELAQNYLRKTGRRLFEKNRYKAILIHHENYGLQTALHIHNSISKNLLSSKDAVESNFDCEWSHLLCDEARAFLSKLPKNERASNETVRFYSMQRLKKYRGDKDWYNDLVARKGAMDSTLQIQFEELVRYAVDYFNVSREKILVARRGRGYTNPLKSIFIKAATDVFSLKSSVVSRKLG